MKYYQVSRSAEPKDIGIKDGTSQVKLLSENSPNYKNFANHFSGFNKNFFEIQDEIKSLNPPIFNGVLRKNAKVTDIMQYGQVFFYLYYLYSSKYIKILETHNIGDYYLFPFKVDNVQEMCYLMFINTIPTKELAFEDSVFITGHKVLDNQKYHKIDSYEMYKDVIKTTPLLTYEKIAISREHFGKDIIAVQGVGDYFYSEKLIDFLLDCDITGLQVGYRNSIQLEFVE